jgi:membrane-bound serine protease (ClpP class)
MYEAGIRHKILSFLGDPTVAYLLLMLGFYGLFFELTSPGSIVPGVIGSICIVLALYALQTLPVNYAGVALIVIGIVLFLLEIKITSYGLLTVGGLIALFFGSLMLFDASAPFLRLSLSVVIPAVLVSGLFFGSMVRLGVRAQRQQPTTGQEGLIGREGIARSAIGPHGGTVLIRGELWSAVSAENISAGELIIVQAVKGLTVTVRRPAA